MYVVEFHPGYHRFSKPLAATAAPAKANKARKGFMLLKRCASAKGVQMQERRKGICSKGTKREKSEEP